MNDERTVKCLQQVEHIRGHLLAMLPVFRDCLILVDFSMTFMSIYRL